MIQTHLYKTSLIGELARGKAKEEMEYSLRLDKEKEFIPKGRSNCGHKEKPNCHDSVKFNFAWVDLAQTWKLMILVISLELSNISTNWISTRVLTGMGASFEILFLIQKRVQIRTNCSFVRCFFHHRYFFNAGKVARK